ncbi:MAG: HgcAB-associated protein [Dehalogenimonas sp.]|jgi:AbrB family looped-hinge helix DNA binding protein|uniref:HgcAB-associated protein n=1 Tax=Candidatus Dehalogenimonas loeffleri TaxID=3127115 RepID=A0ABZ2J4X3_9CHLR|nr:HgcAB-associated protein [Dehalogenimonas sp.]
MAKEKTAANSCCDTGECCRVEAVVGVDARGQVVLPKEIREGMGITAGEKLALVTLNRDGKPCCLVMMKADKLAKGAGEFLGPILKEI